MKTAFALLLALVSIAQPVCADSDADKERASIREASKETLAALYKASPEAQS